MGPWEKLGLDEEQYKKLIERGMLDDFKADEARLDEQRALLEKNKSYDARKQLSNAEKRFEDREQRLGDLEAAGFSPSEARSVDSYRDKPLPEAPLEDEGLFDVYKPVKQKMMADMKAQGMSDNQILAFDMLTPDGPSFVGMAKKLGKLPNKLDWNPVSVSRGTFGHANIPVKKPDLTRSIRWNNRNLTHKVYVDNESGQVRHFLFDKDKPVASILGDVGEYDGANGKAEGLVVSRSFADPKYKGAGKALYDLALDSHGTIISDTSLSPGSQSVYRHYYPRKKGVAATNAARGGDERFIIEKESLDSKELLKPLKAKSFNEKDKEKLKTKSKEHYSGYGDEDDYDDIADRENWSYKRDSIIEQNAEAFRERYPDKALEIAEGSREHDDLVRRYADEADSRMMEKADDSYDESMYIAKHDLSQEIANQKDSFLRNQQRQRGRQLNMARVYRLGNVLGINRDDMNKAKDNVLKKVATGDEARSIRAMEYDDLDQFDHDLIALTNNIPDDLETGINELNKATIYRKIKSSDNEELKLLTKRLEKEAANSDPLRIDGMDLAFRKDLRDRYYDQALDDFNDELVSVKFGESGSDSRLRRFENKIKGINKVFPGEYSKPAEKIDWLKFTRLDEGDEFDELNAMHRVRLSKIERLLQHQKPNDIKSIKSDIRSQLKGLKTSLMNELKEEYPSIFGEGK